MSKKKRSFEEMMAKGKPGNTNDYPPLVEVPFEVWGQARQCRAWIELHGQGEGR